MQHPLLKPRHISETSLEALSWHHLGNVPILLKKILGPVLVPCGADATEKVGLLSDVPGARMHNDISPTIERDPAV